MFSKKLHADVKKSTQKIQDVKKESPTRFKHLRIILENVDTEEAKTFFDTNFSHIYYIFYDNFIIAETNLKQKELPFHLVHKAHREELEAVLLMLDKILTLCPELISRRWQLHSLTRILTKLLHPGNSWKLRREAIRFFLLWYQALADNSPDSVHAMFSTLVPGFPSPFPEHPGLSGLSSLSSATVFHDITQGPISPAEIQPVFPPQGGEKQPEDHMKFFLDALLEFMVTQVSRLEWRDKVYKQHKCFMFLFDRLKMYYLPHMFPTFSTATSLYKPVLDLPGTAAIRDSTLALRAQYQRGLILLLSDAEPCIADYRWMIDSLEDKITNICGRVIVIYLTLLRPRFTSEERKRVEPFINCRVAFIKWIANFTHSTKKDQLTQPVARSASITPSESEGERSPSSELRRVSVGANLTPGSSVATTIDDSSSLTPFIPHTDHYLSEDPNITAINIVRDVLYSTRENVNMIHEVYRQAFLLNFTYSPAIRRAITVYKDWIQMNVPELPPFMLEPLDSQRSSGPSSAEYTNTETPDEIGRQTRLRNDSYIGAINKENLLVRAGLQNVLQVFITHAANVFLLEISHEFPVLLEEQVDTCKRVLNIYRYMVMHTHMEARTWEQLLLVLLQITSLILSKSPPKRKEDTLGGKLAPAIFQTLIVTWIKANLNVVISSELWDQFLSVLSSLTQWEQLIREWAKTLDTLTRVLARHVYNLDLNDLPLDRLSEQKSKRQRRSGSGPRGSAGNCGDQPRDTEQQLEDKHTTDSATDSGTVTVTLKSCESWPVLRRTSSESAISWARRRRSCRRYHHLPVNTNTTIIPVLSSGVEQEVARIIAGARPRTKLNGRSRSLDSIVHLTGDGSGYFDGELSRSPSPAPSSGVESNSFKESPMQIDMLGSDGTTVDPTDGDRRSVMSGGSVRGWLPDVAVVLWRRMLGALGDINTIRDPNLHAQVFQYLVELVDTLAKIKLNQGVPGDNQATPPLPELVPPLTLAAPWCFQALTLPEAFNRGKLFAYRLLCNIVLSSHDTPLPPGLLTQFYRVIHMALTCSDQNTLNTVVRYCGPRLFSLQLPGFSLLLLDFIHACNAVICCSDLRTTPRTEAMSILGSFLSFPPVLFQMPMLQPTAKDFTARSAPDAKEHVVKILLRSGKAESAGVARCIALSSLGIFVYQQLSQINSCPVHPKIKEAINTLLLALRFNHKTVAQVASDVLLLLTDHSQALLKHFSEIPPRIVEVLASTLSHLMPVGDSDKRLLTSLVFCLGEWTMRLPPQTLLTTKNNSCLLLSIFKVLTDLSEGGRNRASCVVGGSFHPDLVQEFNPNIQLDNLKQDDSMVMMGRRTFNSPPHLSSPAHSVQLAAKMVVMHLLNHLGHFPLAIGAARLSSLVVEHDDVPGMAADQLSAQVFSAHNIQLFVLSTNLLMSLVQLPTLEVPGGGVTAGLVTATSQVRVILRDLAGKATWDASILYCTPEQLKLCGEDLALETWSQERTLEETMLNSCIVAPTVPQHTLRHRQPSVLPTYENSADDLDNLDDLLQYIGETSPECLESLDTPRNIPAPPPHPYPELEQEAMGSVVGQRFLEQDYVSRSANLSMMQAERCTRLESRLPQSPFQHCRLLFSQLGLAGWERRAQLHLLEKSEKLLRELRNLDTQRCRETHKIAVIYIAPGQEDKNSILSNTGGSQAYEDFIAALAWEVELESHTGFMGGLQRNKTTGSTAPYYATSFTEVIFHVSTRMPSSNHEALLQKTRHLGNDEVHIVWSEHSRDYRRGIIPTEFCDVLIVVYPRPHRMFRVQVSRKPEVPYFGPLFNEVVVSEHTLAGLVRATAISASRAKRSVIPFHQQYYEERSRSLETVMKNHKNSTTFEEFAAQVYSPIQTPSPFCPGPTRASGVSSRSVEQQIPSSNSSNLAAALLDSHPRGPPEPYKMKGLEGAKVWFVGGDGDHSHQHGISPRPLKKLVLKSGAKRHPLTPPDSPTSRRSK